VELVILATGVAAASVAIGPGAPTARALPPNAISLAVLGCVALYTSSALGSARGLRPFGAASFGVAFIAITALHLFACVRFVDYALLEFFTSLRVRVSMDGPFAVLWVGCGDLVVANARATLPIGLVAIPILLSLVLIVRTRNRPAATHLRVLLTPILLGLLAVIPCLAPIAAAWWQLPLMRLGSITVVLRAPSERVQRAAFAETGFAPHEYADLGRLRRAGRLVTLQSHERLEAILPGSYALCTATATGTEASAKHQIRCRTIEVQEAPAEQSFELP
jgi:hypothetical protein